MRRNALYRKRHFLSTLLEIMLPIAFTGILIAIKNSLGDDIESELVPPTFPDTLDVFRPLSFLDYVTTLQAPRICTAPELTGIDWVDAGFGDFDVTGMPLQGYDWQNPFVRCDNRLCKEEGQDAQDFCEYMMLGVAASGNAAQDRAQDFVDYIISNYPGLADTESLPFDFDFVRLFDSEAQLESYVTAEDYGKNGKPKVAMAVVWEGDAATTNQYSYSLRQNSTGYNIPAEAARPGALTTPDTTRVLDPFAPNDRSCPIFDGAAFVGPRQSSCTGQYLYNGIVTMQKLVGDFILSDSGTNTQVADHGIRFVSMPTKEYEDGGFFEDIASTLKVFVVVSYYDHNSPICLTYSSLCSLCSLAHYLGIALSSLANDFVHLS